MEARKLHKAHNSKNFNTLDHSPVVLVVLLPSLRLEVKCQWHQCWKHTKQVKYARRRKKCFSSVIGTKNLENILNHKYDARPPLRVVDLSLSENMRGTPDPNWLLVSWQIVFKQHPFAGIVREDCQLQSSEATVNPCGRHWLDRSSSIEGGSHCTSEPSKLEVAGLCTVLLFKGCFYYLL